MLKRGFQVKDASNVANCPKCGNNDKFIGCCEQVAEDGCEVWVECYECNYNPFADVWGSCIESVMGSLDNDNLMMSVSEWTFLIEQSKTTEK